ncbi:interleukin-27 subunit beta [Chanos chanos]|uniref:Interleukin-27 subunit beta n=1 Tax=Chanos chanos TaxID=29144 RepID=A0A6J2VDQ5_CHACN|nr:interleukin-27 subunit beta-like [Chanos chanos]
MFTQDFRHICIIISIISGVLRNSSSSLLKDQKTVKDVYGAIGSDVELPCEGRDGGEVEWKLNGLVVSSGPVLTLHNVSLKDQGNYTCQSLSGDHVLTAVLQLGYPPSPPVVQCWSPTYPLKVICSWTGESSPLLPTHYITTYRDLKSEVHPCKRSSELVNECVLEGLEELFSSDPYLFNITTVNPLGSTIRILPIVLEHIVKPDPPVNVRVTLLPRRKLSVEWDPPPTWLEHFPLKYTVHYSWHQNGSNRKITLGPFESKSMNISGLAAGRTYQIQISAKDFLDQGQSSSWSQPVNISLPSR